VLYTTGIVLGFAYSCQLQHILLFVVCSCSVIEVGSPELAKKTVEVMHRADIRGRQIIVREARSEFLLA